jgi:hypothetical protein
MFCTGSCAHASEAARKPITAMERNKELLIGTLLGLSLERETISL